MIDLSHLDAPEPSTSAAESTGQPIMIDCDRIHLRDDQPRRTLTEASIESMAETIRVRVERGERGVKTPISVSHHPDIAGDWLLNFGQRRWRGSEAAGQKQVPGFVDPPPDDDDALLENVQREDLDPLDLAHAIRRLIEKGRSQAEIARSLGKPASTITQHLALIDLPGPLAGLYADGRCRSPRHLYDLRRAFEDADEAGRKAVELELDEGGVVDGVRAKRLRMLAKGAEVESKQKGPLPEPKREQGRRAQSDHKPAPSARSAEPKPLRVWYDGRHVEVYRLTVDDGQGGSVEIGAGDCSIRKV